MIENLKRRGQSLTICKMNPMSLISAGTPLWQAPSRFKKCFTTTAKEKKKKQERGGTSKEWIAERAVTQVYSL